MDPTAICTSADLGGNFGGVTYPGIVYQFSTATQQVVDALELPAGFSPGGLTFATDGTHDLIVGDINSGEVLQYNADDSLDQTLVSVSNGVPLYALLGVSGGNLLIADVVPDATGYCDIMEYNATTGLNSTPFIVLDQGPNGTTQYGDLGYPPIPTVLALDSDGNLLVGLAPGESGDGAVLKYDITTGALLGTIASGIGALSGLGLAHSIIGHFDKHG